jgi:hypothetical protein
LDAERCKALLKSDSLKYPCQLPLADGGWYAECSGPWGRCGVFADTLTELADRLIELWKKKSNNGVAKYIDERKVIDAELKKEG